MSMCRQLKLSTKRLAHITTPEPGKCKHLQDKGGPQQSWAGTCTHPKVLDSPIP